MASSINASLTAGIVQTADTSGNLNLQSGGSTKLAVTSAGVAVTGTLSSTGNTTLGDASTDTLNVGNGNLVTDASGSVGVGVTPSTWSTGKAIELGSVKGNALWGIGANACTLLSNANFNSGYVYANNGFANRYDNGGASGSHAWFTAPSGTAGNAITFTTAMTLDASGNLGIGVTPSAWSAAYSCHRFYLGWLCLSFF